MKALEKIKSSIERYIMYKLYNYNMTLRDRIELDDFMFDNDIEIVLHETTRKEKSYIIVKNVRVADIERKLSASGKKELKPKIKWLC